MKVLEIMSEPAITIAPHKSLEIAAFRMRIHAVGALPVVVGDFLAGIITDRDLAMALSGDRGIGHARSVSNHMTTSVLCCHANDSIEVAAALMGDHQIRRLPVLDERGRLSGMLSIGDIAVHVCERMAGEVLGEIAERR